jgi:hypothetical protein
MSQPRIRITSVGGSGDGTPGADGLSAYEVAVENGFVGTEQQWLDSLVGPAGADGADGAVGATGATGPTGPTGADGAQGDPGIGIPTGGTGGQILAKIDDTNYNTEWIDNWATYSGYTSILKHEVKAGVALTKGQAVYVSSADGTNMIVSKASNASEQTSSKTMGLVETSVSLNGKVNVITEGLLTGLNTNGATAGDPVWLGTNGNLIYGLTNKPVAPAHLVFIGIVTRANQNNGEIFIRPQNGFELEELHNLVLTNVQDGDAIVWDSSTSKWINYAIPAGPQGETGPTGATGPQGETGPAPTAPFTITQSGNNASYPLTISSANQQNGGTGYADIIKMTNTVAGTTNPNKFIRMNSSGSFEIVNNAYSATLLFLDDNGNLSASGALGAGAYTAGQHVKTTIWNASEMGFSSTYTQSTNSYTTIASKSYSPGSSSSYIFFEVYARYAINGAAEDSFISQLTWNGIEIGIQRQYWSNASGGGTRSSTLFPLTGRVTNSGGTFTLAINARRDSSDDTLQVYADNAFYVKITEIAR